MPQLELYRSGTYVERLLRLDLWTLEERRNRFELTEVFELFNGHTESYKEL